MNDSFRKLEEILLNPNVRKSSMELQGLLSDDFIEYGSSGKIYDKALVMESLKQESTSQHFSILEFNAKELSPGIVLVTYTVQRLNTQTGSKNNSLRSSIWKLTDGKWKIVFHQGTNVNG